MKKQKIYAEILEQEALESLAKIRKACFQLFGRDVLATSEFETIEIMLKQNSVLVEALTWIAESFHATQPIEKTAKEALKQIELIHCLRCETINPSDAKRCHYCGVTFGELGEAQ